MIKIEVFTGNSEAVIGEVNLWIEKQNIDIEQLINTHQTDIPASVTEDRIFTFTIVYNGMEDGNEMDRIDYTRNE